MSSAAPRSLKAAIVGSGFVAAVHVEALRGIGVEVVGVVGSSPAKARAAAVALRIPRAYDSFEQMLGDDAVDVVHLTSPNAFHYPQAMECLSAEKHVVCEKPLAISSEESARLVERAEASGLMNCVNFNLRFYPQVQEARRLLGGGAIGAVWNARGSYLQDWLLSEADWNWRVDPAVGGPLRAVADIGSHWLDLAQFVTGRRVRRLVADLTTAIPFRGEPVATEDFANVLLCFDDGSRGSMTVSQVSAGSRNALSLHVEGAEGSVKWSSERHEELWLGRRDSANETLLRDRAEADPDSLPAGHSEGFRDTFRRLYRAAYGSIEIPLEEAVHPTFRDGHAQQLLADAIRRSHLDGTWVEVPA